MHVDSELVEERLDDVSLALNRHLSRTAATVRSCVGRWLNLNSNLHLTNSTTLVFSLVFCATISRGS